MQDKFVSLLKKHELKITPQRLEILRYLDTHHSHPTVEEIYSELKQNTPSLSKTTVYNALETLKKHKIIQTVIISGNETRYDLKNTHHHHFLCLQCGAIIDIDITCPNIKKIQQQGYDIKELHGYFKGICPKCQQKRGGKTHHESKNTT